MKLFKLFGVGSLVWLGASVALADTPPPDECGNSATAGQACNTAGPDTEAFEGTLPGVCVLMPLCPGHCGAINQCGVDAGCYLDAGSPTYFECLQTVDAGSSTTAGTSAGATTGASSGTTTGTSSSSSSGTTSSGGVSDGGTTTSSGGCGQPGPMFGPWLLALIVPLLLWRRRRAHG